MRQSLGWILQEEKELLQWQHVYQQLFQNLLFSFSYEAGKCPLAVGENLGAHHSFKLQRCKFDCTWFICWQLSCSQQLNVTITGWKGKAWSSLVGSGRVCNHCTLNWLSQLGGIQSWLKLNSLLCFYHRWTGCVQRQGNCSCSYSWPGRRWSAWTWWRRFGEEETCLGQKSWGPKYCSSGMWWNAYCCTHWWWKGTSIIEDLHNNQYYR